MREFLQSSFSLRLLKFIFLFPFMSLHGENYVTVRIQGQLGNQFFQIAAAYAYALDHNIPLVIPDLINQKAWNLPTNAERLYLHKIAHHDLISEPFLRWAQPHLYYCRIPKINRIELNGYFQTEKYFKHRRKEILELFAPPPGMNEKILEKYPFLSSERLTVAIQIRDYRPEFSAGDYHPTHGREYYAQAVEKFPRDAIFLVSGNNPEFVRECTEGLRENMIYLDSGDYIEELYTLALCKAFIISNSSFGWWAAWLSTHLEKVLVAPSPWWAYPYDDRHSRDILPKETIVITSKAVIK